MAILDKIIGAATPPESPEKRMEARGKARAEAQPGDWQNYMGDAAPMGDLHPHVPVEPRSFAAS